MWPALLPKDLVEGDKKNLAFSVMYPFPFRPLSPMKLKVFFFPKQLNYSMFFERLVFGRCGNKGVCVATKFLSDYISPKFYSIASSSPFSLNSQKNCVLHNPVKVEGGGGGLCEWIIISLTDFVCSLVFNKCCIILPEKRVL